MKLIKLLDVMQENEMIWVVDVEGNLLYCGRVANITFQVIWKRQVIELEPYSDGGSKGIRIKVE